MARRASRIGYLLAILACLVAFAWGLQYLFALRFARGDVYPPYSSFRTDPLGAKVIYDALGDLPDLDVSRNRQSFSKLADPRGTTIFYLGTPMVREEFNRPFPNISQIPKPELDQLERLVAGGARLVITFFPVRSEQQSWGFPKEEVNPKSDKPVDKPAEDESETPNPMDLVQLDQEWGFGFNTRTIPADPELVPSAFPEGTAAIEAGVPWYSTMIFDNLDDAWRTVYRRGQWPVIVEREYGSGTIVLCSDSHFISNEAMSTARRLKLVSWLAGPNRRLVFDETHLGVTVNPGVATLARKYQLHGVVAALAVLVALFVWKNAAGLLPPYEAVAPERRAAGKDVSAGLVNLLRRGIPPAQIIGTCIAEWKKSFAQSRPDVARVIDETPLPRNPVRAYQQLARIISERKYK